MSEEHHGAVEVREDLVRALQESEGKTLVITYKYWEGDGFSVSTREGDLLVVDTVWPAAFMRSSVSGARRIPLGYILTVATPDGSILWSHSS